MKPYTTYTRGSYPAPVKEAIILAGGLGTRLRESVPDLPKCMAPVAGRPFLFHVVNHLRNEGIERIIFSLGYKHEVIEAWLRDAFPALDTEIVIEDEPLGTGGAIQLAMQKAREENVLVTNGDTLFKVSVTGLFELHQSARATCTLALKPMQEFDRFGVVEISGEGKVTGFREKKYYTSGLINGGTYIISAKPFLANGFPEKFSFEKDFLETLPTGLYGCKQDGYFIDIGIPEDFQRADIELTKPPLDLSKIDSTWTLFLDRDGVINVDKEGSYIFHPNEFLFLEGAPALFKKLADRFGKIFLATNQRGVGRGLMDVDMLNLIHGQMVGKIEEAGGRIDRIYAATALENTDTFRKPNNGMALAARYDFPGTDLSKSIMVGNNLSDMQFGRNTGMYTVFITTTRPHQAFPHPDIDLIYPLLADFAKAL